MFSLFLILLIVHPAIERSKLAIILAELKEKEQKSQTNIQTHTKRGGVRKGDNYLCGM